MKNVQSMANLSRLKTYYFESKINKKQFEAEKEFLVIEFISDEDVVKVHLCSSLTM